MSFNHCEECLSGGVLCSFHSWNLPNPQQQWPNHGSVPPTGPAPQQGEPNVFGFNGAPHPMAGVGYYHCASSALGRGLGRATRDADLDSLVDDVGVIPMRHRTSNMSSTSAHPPETPTRPSTASSRNLLTPNVAAGYSRKTMVDFEHDRYLGLPDSKEYKDLGKVDLVKYWNIQASLPLLRAISKDVLPAQATSVSSERIFSSSKLICAITKQDSG